MRRIGLIAVLLLALTTLPTFAELAIPQNPLWKPIADTVYLQEVSTHIETNAPLTAVAVYAGAAYVGDADGVHVFDGATLKRAGGPAGAVSKLKTLGDALWAVAADGLWRFDGGAWAHVADARVVDVCLHNDQVAVATNTGLYAVTGDALTPLTDRETRNLQGVASYSGTLYVHDGRQVGLLEDGRIMYENIADWGHLQYGATIRDMMSFGSRLIVATDEGLGVLRGMTWYPVRGENGLPVEDTIALAWGFDNELWIGTGRGAIRQLDDEQYHYFGPERWLPNKRVIAISSGDNVVYIATDGGLGIITYEPYTLAKKAAYYERWLDEWGMKRLGFIHILFREDGQWVREVSDNDVGYSSHYLAAKCFEYAVTGNPEARAEAVDMMKTVKWSEEITSIDGFPARSIYSAGETAHKAMHGSGGLPAEWHATPDGQWEWKGDTSSDEVDAHVYETMLFLELVANEEERVWATDHLRRVVGHIVDNGFFLRDVDGKPTRWARWDPEYLQTPYGFYARGLNGMEAFNYVTTAYHFTGDEKFARAKQFHLEQGYLPDILRQKLTDPREWTHFDDRLAFYSYYPLVQYETDPELKAIWLRSLERSWEIKRSEAVPWFNFIYGALTGNDCETDRAVDHLRGWPLDLRRYAYTNSHRDDLHMPDGYRVYGERPKPINPREGEPNRWDGDFMRLDGGYPGGGVVSDPGGWLDAYWMGRYYGMITGPQTDVSELTTVPERNIGFGAAPYAGPARPKLWHEQ